MSDIFSFYKTQSPYSSFGKHESLINELPNDMESLTKTIQGLIVHQHETKKFYGFELPKEREIEPNTRYMEEIVNIIIRLENKPLAVEREPQKKFIGLCRDFALFLCAVLRHRSIPARLRCGFANYFDKENHVDHWLCEYWDDKRQRWVLVDAEVDEMERKHYKLPESFDNLNVTQEQFWFSSKAWKAIRENGENPHTFGVPSIGITGAWFVRANLFRDLAALNKVELCPWDYTKYSDKQWETLDEMPTEELKKLDLLAELISEVNNKPGNVIEFYNKNPSFQVGESITSYTNLGPQKVSL